VYHRILIPVSGPNEVESLIRFGANLLDADGEIRLLHVIPTTSLPELTRRWRASVRIVVPAHETGAALDIRVDPEVRAGHDVAGEILETAESHAADAILLTLGSDRRGRNPFIGRTSSSLLQHAHSDVLIVNRIALLAEAVPRILLPTVGGPPSPKAIHVAEEIAMRNRGAPVIAMTIGAKERPDTSGAAPPTHTPRGVPFQHRYSVLPETRLLRRRRLPEVILQHAAKERYGLLILSEPASPGEGPLLTRRLLEDLFRDAPCPVLAVRG